MESNKLDQMIKFSFSKITTFLNKDGIEKKKMVTNGIEWGNIKKTTIDKKHGAVAVICGKISGITIFDFDDLSEYKKLVKTHPELLDCYTIETKKGVHIYFNYNEFCTTTTNGLLKIKNVYKFKF